MHAVRTRQARRGMLRYTRYMSGLVISREQGLRYDAVSTWQARRVGPISQGGGQTGDFPRTAARGSQVQGLLLCRATRRRAGAVHAVRG